MVGNQDTMPCGLLGGLVGGLIDGWVGIGRWLDGWMDGLVDGWVQEPLWLMLGELLVWWVVEWVGC